MTRHSDPRSSWLRQRTYELQQTSSGRFYVRYLPRGVAIGDPRQDFRIEKGEKF